MRTCCLLVPALFLASLPSMQGAKLERVLLLKDSPPACQTAFSNPPQGYTTFQTTDQKAVLWFTISDAQVGDVAASEYYTPNGQYYGVTSGEWSPVRQGGNVCFEDVPFEIAGAFPAQNPGIWRVRIIYNNQILTEIQFTIQTPGSGGGGGGTPVTTANLVRNGGAELVATTSCSAGVPAIPEWTTNGRVGVCPYTAGGGYPGVTTPGPPDRGNNFFTGGGSDIAAISQIVDLSSYATSIDAGTQPFTLSAYLGGYDSQSDNAVVRVTFRGSGGGSLGTATIGPVTASDRNNATSLLLRQATGNIPRNTRSIEILLTATRTDGSGNDGYADNISFALSSSGGGGGGGGGGGATGQVNFIELRGGSFSNNSYSGSGEVWDTEPANGFWVLGVSNPSTTAPLLNTTTPPGINIVPGTYYLYNEPTSLGSAVRIMIRWASGVTESAVFQVGPLTQAANWTRLSGASNIALASTGLTNVNRVGGGNNAVTPGGGADIVLQLVIGAPGTSVDGGGGGSGGQADFVELHSGSFANNAFSSGGNIWDTSPGTEHWVLGVSNPSTTATLLNTTTAPGISLVPGTYYIYAEPTAGRLHTAVRITIRWTTGVTETAVFQVGSLTQAGTWTRLSGASNIGLASTGLTNVNRVGSGNNAVTPAGSADDVLQLVIGAPGTTVDGGGGGGGGGGATCNYMINPLTQSVPGTAATGLVLVNTATGCQWTATSNAAWITITAGQSGTGSGAVSYNVAANPNTAPRTGTLTIAGQTHTVTQGAGGAAACTFEILPASASVAAAGGAGAVAVTASASNCAWTASSGVAWVTFTTSSGTGSGTARFNVAANTTTSARNTTLTIAGRSFALTQAAGSAAGGPVISAGGIVNAGSFVSSDFPNGGIARGSFFSIFGANIGPATPAQANEYPIRTTLGGVSIRVTLGSTSVDALPVFVSSTQINAIMASNAPLGDATLVVTVNGRSSAPMRVRIVNSNFGAFTTAGGRGPGIFQNYVSQAEQPLNTTGSPARRTQIVTLWGTGLGPISAPDSMPPPAGDLPVNVEIYVGGKLARKLYSGRAPCCAGVDQIVFEIPPDAPLGCYVPVQVKVAEVTSNPVTIALSDGGRCTDPGNPFGDLVTRGGKTGILVLARISALAALQQGQPPVDITLDLGGALFVEQRAGGDLGYNPALSLPPLGTCTSFTGSLDASALLGSATGGDTSSLTPDARWLNAGPTITLTGARGAIPLNPADEEKGGSPYIGLLGGSLPLPGAPSLPLFLETGSYTISGPGGPDVGAFSSNFSIPGPITWTNRDSMTEINRRAPLTFRWSGGDPNRQSVLLAGASTDQTTKASAGFFCLVPANTGQFSVPTSVLESLPATPGTNLEESGAALIFASVPAGTDTPKFSAPGIESGIVLNGSLSLRTVPVR